jgi:hypothetical protein
VRPIERCKNSYALVRQYISVLRPVEKEKLRKSRSEVLAQLRLVFPATEESQQIISRSDKGLNGNSELQSPKSKARPQIAITPTSFSTSAISIMTMASHGQPSRKQPSGPLLMHFLHPMQRIGSI